jgi:hypothetical protein
MVSETWHKTYHASESGTSRETAGSGSDTVPAVPVRNHGNLLRVEYRHF